MTETTRERAMRLAKEAGFRVFGDKVVAADNGVSGRATDSIETLIRLATNEALEKAAQKCLSLKLMSDKPVHNEDDCAEAIRKMKEE